LIARSYANLSKKFKEIPLTVVGIDFRIAPSALRQELVTSPEERQLLFREIRKIDSQAEFMALETCNRVEWIVATVEPLWMSEILKARMMMVWKKSGAAGRDFPAPFTHTGIQALRHMFNVVVGKESLATGEAQIAGQFHESCNKARLEKTTGPVLKRLAVAGGRLAKAGARTGFRSNQKMGIHGLVTRFFEHHLSASRNQTVLVVGMGSIGRKTAQLLTEHACCKVLCFNRSVDSAHEGKWLPLEDLAKHTQSADGLVIATGASEAVLGREDVLERPNSVPLLVLDIGIPLQVRPDLQESEWVSYHNIDDLMKLPGRQEKEPVGLVELNGEIQREVELFEQFCRERQQQITRVFSKLHRGRQEFIHRHIPELIEQKLDFLNAPRRKEVQEAMKELINTYAREIHESLVEAIHAFGGMNHEHHHRNEGE